MFAYIDNNEDPIEAYVGLIYWEVEKRQSPD